MIIDLIKKIVTMIMKTYLMKNMIFYLQKTQKNR